MLQSRADIARHVRELVVRPRATSQARHGTAVSAMASAAVRDAAATLRMDALKKFVWDGEEKPYHEDMWFALRIGCVARCITSTLCPYESSPLKLPTTAVHRNVRRDVPSCAQ